MADPSKPQPKTLDTLQSMVNAVLLETSKALRGAAKDTGGIRVSANNRIRMSIPATMNNFQLALDDLEAEILRAKAAFTRDLDELRSARIAAETPPIEVAPEAMVKEESKADIDIDILDDLVTQPQLVKEESKADIDILDDLITQPQLVKEDPLEVEAEVMEEIALKDETAINETGNTATQISEISGLPNQLQAPLTPPKSDEVKLPMSLDIDTAMADTSTPAPGTAGLPDSAVDSLFDIPDGDDGNDNNDNSELDFAMDFLNDTTTNEPPQTQNSEFDLSTFGATHDFNLPSLQASAGTNAANNAAANDSDDLFGIGNATAGGSSGMMDIDSSMLPAAEENSFDDLFFTGDDGGLSGGSNDRTFDDDFFDIEG